MKGLFRYKYLAIIGIGLILILFLAMLAGSVLTRRSSEGTVAPTLIPPDSDRPHGFGGNVVPTLSDDEGRTAKKGRVFSAEQLERLRRFDKVIPYYSQDFDIDYSKLLDQYFVHLKTEDAAAKFEEFLRSYGLLDIRNVYRDLFVTGDKAVYVQIQEAEDAYSKNQ